MRRAARTSLDVEALSPAGDAADGVAPPVAATRIGTYMRTARTAQTHVGRMASMDAVEEAARADESEEWPRRSTHTHTHIKWRLIRLVTGAAPTRAEVAMGWGLGGGGKARQRRSAAKRKRSGTANWEAVKTDVSFLWEAYTRGSTRSGPCMKGAGKAGKRAREGQRRRETVMCLVAVCDICINV